MAAGNGGNCRRITSKIKLCPISTKIDIQVDFEAANMLGSSNWLLGALFPRILGGTKIAKMDINKYLYDRFHSNFVGAYLSPSANDLYKKWKSVGQTWPPLSRNNFRNIKNYLVQNAFQNITRIQLLCSQTMDSYCEMINNPPPITRAFPCRRTGYAQGISLS